MVRTICGVLALSAASFAHGATLLDFGTDPGKINNTTAGFSIWGGWGAMGFSRSFSADSVNLTYTSTADWASKGEQYRGSLLGTIDLTGVSALDKLALDARVILGSPAPSFYLYTVTLLAADGSSSSYQFINSVRTNPTPFSYGTDPSTVPFTVVEATTAIGAPTATNAGNGAFNFATDVLSGIDIYYQTGTNGGTVAEPRSVTMEIGALQINAIPEPSALGLLAVSGLLALRRKRA